MPETYIPLNIKDKYAKRTLNLFAPLIAHNAKTNINHTDAL
jgi:hypothetical protein